jgi:hypothetical protein
MLPIHNHELPRLLHKKQLVGRQSKSSPTMANIFSHFLLWWQ